MEEFLKKLEEKRNERVYNVGGMSTCGVLGTALIVLKCMGYIHCSWLWATAPFWIPLAFVFSVVAIVAFVALFVILYNCFTNKDNTKIVANIEINDEPIPETTETTSTEVTTITANVTTTESTEKKAKKKRSRKKKEVKDEQAN